MRLPKLTTPAVLFGLAVAPGMFAQTVLVNDTFSDTDRIGGTSGSSTTSSSPTISTPTSTNTQWIGTRVSQEVASASGMLWTMDSSSRIVTGYYPDVTLAANTTTTFSVSFTTGNFGATGNNLRIAITDGSANGIRSTDGVGSTDASYVGDLGYGFFSGNNLGGGVTTDLTYNIRTRTTTTSNNLLGTSADWTAIGNSSGATGNFEANTAYTLQFIFAYNGTSTDITTTITGGNFSSMSVTATDASPVTNFNQFTLRLGGGSAQFSNLNFTSFSVSQTSAVPEPSTYAALLGLGVMGFAAWRRQRRTA